MYFSFSLVLAVSIHILCQVFKVVLYSVKERNFKPVYFLSAGGMPSTHSALVTCLTLSLGIQNGFNTEIFAVAAVFSAIVIYDAVRLRGTVQIHSKVINRVQKMLPKEEQEKIPEMVGHTVPEIVIGILVGGVYCMIVYIIKWNFFT